MKRTTIYLFNEAYQGLRKLAFEENTSVATLIRKAVQSTYGEDIEDIRVMEEEIAKYQAHPGDSYWLRRIACQKKVNV